MSHGIQLSHIVHRLDAILNSHQPFELECFTNDRDKTIIRVQSFKEYIDITYHTHPRREIEFDIRESSSRSEDFYIDDTAFEDRLPKFCSPNDDVSMTFFNRIRVNTQVTENVNYKVDFNKNDRLAERMIELTFLIEEHLDHPLPSHMWDLYK